MGEQVVSFPAMIAARSKFLSGMKAELPILVGVIPFGVIYGILAMEGGSTVLQALAMSILVFAGSAQFIMAQLFGLGTPVLVIIFTAVMVNLRHALYSASIAPHVSYLSRGWRWLLAYLLTDEAYAVTILHYREAGEASRKHWYYLGAGLALWLTWQFSTALGVVLRAQVPSSWSFDFTLALTFIALIVPALKDTASFAAALAAGLAAVLAFQMPYKLGLVTAVAVGIIVALAVESRQK